VPNTATQATGVPTVNFGFIVNAAVTSGGSGYGTSPTVTVNDPTGSGAVIAASISGGAVIGLTVQNPGSGYSAGATLTIAPPPSNAFQTFVSPNFFTGVNTMNNVNNTFAGSFAGNGAGLTALNANNLSSGTVPLARLSGITSNQLDAATWQLLTNVNAATLAIPPGMALIPAGAFTMGNSVGDGDITDASPTNVTVSAFYLDVNLVSLSQWQSVYFWATNHGFGFVNVGAGKAANQPVQTVDWYDTVKWCNARSQQAGKTPVYYTDAGLTQVFTNGEVTPYVNWTASGYRLPTEAEWEKAARGGLSGQRFPWGNVITESLANYYGATASYSYDLGPNGYNSIGSIGVTPYTSPVGSFAPNGYGLYDMAGNVFEWCWDWYGTYAGGSDPRGPASGSSRVLRGGSWVSSASYSRCAVRLSYSPSVVLYNFGFRCVRGL
jgi:formylglycine-generating enzyme required for sulfatase activity